MDEGGPPGSPSSRPATDLLPPRTCRWRSLWWRVGYKLVGLRRTCCWRSLWWRVGYKFGSAGVLT
ncbi:MAG TPA: hypothetical protein P5193_03055 [Microthrixaceae bacterium]|nr:hypothetical protein [Microthrixaceae bacterium]HNG24984.1 hypothetical protein [Microthrixaceae bacterium]HRW40503.1 hypothetical protein [Microthrixaceae bacterium]